MIASKNPVITGCKSIFLHSNGRAALFLPRARAKGRFRIPCLESHDVPDTRDRDGGVREELAAGSDLVSHAHTFTAPQPAWCLNRSR